VRPAGDGNQMVVTFWRRQPLNRRLAIQLVCLRHFAILARMKATSYRQPRGRQPPKLINRRHSIITPEVRQAESAECGLAALAIILGYHGVHVSLEELRESVGSTYLGISAQVLVTLARRYGLESRSFRQDTETLRELEFPLIAHCRFIHFLVVERMTADDVLVNDPDTGPRHIPFEEFDLEFTGVVLTFTPGPALRARGHSFIWWRYLSDLSQLADVLRSVVMALVAALALALTVHYGAAALTRLSAGTPWLASLARAAAVAIMASIFVMWRDNSAGRLVAEAARDALDLTFHRFARLPGAFFVNRHPEQIMTKLEAPVVLAQQAGLAAAALALLTPVVLGVIAVDIDWRAGAAIMFCAALDIVSVALLCGWRGGAVARLGDGAPPFVVPAADLIARIDTFRVGGGEGELFGFLAGRHAALATPLQEAGARFAALSTWRLFLTAASFISALGLGALGLLEGRLEVGDAVALVVLACLMAGTLGNFARQYRLTSLKEAVHELADLDRAQADAPTSRTGATQGTGFRVELTDVGWSAALGEQHAVAGVTLTIEPGRHLGIAGSSASGKTVLAHLLTGIKRPTSGTLRIDGCAPSDLRPGAAVLVERFGAVFDTTLRDNLRLGATLADDALRASLMDVRLWDELAPRGGLEFELSHGGAELSGGQLSRLFIARALLRIPNVLVIDEAFDAVELSLEAHIRNVIRRLGVTLVLVSARTESLRACDQLLRLAAGRAIFFGQP
jgi:ABC-type bacteriocin/lantibiotic exporter with double-glycine peptidase domain